MICLMSFMEGKQAMPEITKALECPITPGNLKQVEITKKKQRMDVYTINNDYFKIPCWDYIMREKKKNQVTFMPRWTWRLIGTSLTHIFNFMISPKYKNQNRMKTKI